MTPLRLLLLISPILIVAQPPQDDGVLVKKSGATRFRAHRDQALAEGDTIRTGAASWTLDYGETGEVWIGPRTDVVFVKGRTLDLLDGELVVKAIEGVFRVRFPGGEAVAEAAAVDMEVKMGEALVSRPVLQEALPEGARTGVVVDGLSGYTLWLEDDQSAVVAYDPQTQATKVFVPEDNTSAIQVDLLDNKVEVIPGGPNLDDMMIEMNVMEIPPGSEVLIQKAVSERPPSERPAAGKLASKPFVDSPWALPLPTDEPFEDSGDILEVVNVSPSQPP